MSLSILVVTAMYPHAERPGSGAFVLHQVQFLRSLGHQVSVVHIRGYQSRWNYFKGAIRVLRATWGGGYNVVHVHYGVTGVSALIRWRTPLVVTLHGSDVLQGRFHPFVSRVISRMADATIVVSPNIAGYGHSTVIPCGVDLEKFRRTDRTLARLQLNLPATGKIVLFPFDPKRPVKRYDIATGAIQLLQANGMDISILTVWNEANDRMPLYYSAADVMVLCSDTEGSPTSVKEALACDLPVVSTDVGDVRSMITGIEGTEVCEQNVPSLAAGLKRSLSRIEKIVFDGRSAVRRFDQVRTTQAIVELYRTVLRGTIKGPTVRN